MSKKNAVVGLYRHDHHANQGSGQSRLVDKVDMGVELKQFLRKRDWKAQVTEKIREKGYEVLALNVGHSGADLDITIVASVDRKPPRFGERRKPVSVGGRSLSDGPVTGKKTMASKRRAGIGARGKR